MELKSNGTTTILNGALIVGAILLLVCGFKYYNKSKSVRTYQILITDHNRLQPAQNIAANLVNDTVEYSKTHPAIESTLEAIGVKPIRTPSTTPKPAAK